MTATAQSARSKTIRLLVMTSRANDLESLLGRWREADPEQYQADWAENFKDGLAALRRGRYDAVLLDQRWSDSGGPLSIQKAAGAKAAPPILLLTDAEEEPDVSLGVMDCLNRASLDPVQLERSICTAVRCARLFVTLRANQQELRREIESARQRETQLLSALTANLPVVIGRLDDNGRVTEATGFGLADLGMAPARLLGRRFARLYPVAADAIDQAILGRPASCGIQGRSHDKNWHVDFFVFPDVSRTGTVLFLARDVTHRKELESRLISVSDAEQQRIGADLHDGLGQHLTGTACIAATLHEKLKAAGSLHAGQAASVVALINAAVDMTRGLARGLCPVQIEVGSLCSALEDFSYQVQRLHSVKCRFRPTGPPLKLEQPVALHLYRIAQEAVNNVLRHSNADEITITLDRAYLAIEDNGGGFDPSAVSDNRRLGLRLMDYRAAMIGGFFKISRRPEGGMRVECVFSHPFSS